MRLYLFILMCLPIYLSAQDTICISNQTNVCQTFWQLFETNSLDYEFQNADGKIVDFHKIIHQTDTTINPLSCDGDWNVEPYILIDNSWNCDKISKLIFIRQNQKVVKIGFVVDLCDDNGNFIDESTLFWVNW